MGHPQHLPHVLNLAVHLVNFLCWMSQGGNSEPLFTDKLLLEHVGLPHVLDLAVHLDRHTQTLGLVELGLRS